MGRIYTRDGKYAIDFVDHRGRRVRRVVATDRSVAQKLLGDAVKAVEKMHPVFTAQVLTYLKLTGLRLGLIVNFNVPLIRDGIRRIIL